MGSELQPQSVKRVQILIADDHEVTREGARRLIEREPGWEVCGIATTGREAVEQAAKLHPDVVVLDMSMPELNGLEAARQIKRLVPRSEILIFTGYDDTNELIHEVFEAGVKSVILKGEASSQLVEAIRSLCEGKAFFTSRVSHALFSRLLDGSRRTSKTSARSLTAREREVVQLLAEGKSNKQVANTLGVGTRTIEAHRASITRKLGLDSFAALVRYAIRNKITRA